MNSYFLLSIIIGFGSVACVSTGKKVVETAALVEKSEKTSLKAMEAFDYGLANFDKPQVCETAFLQAGQDMPQFHEAYFNAGICAELQKNWDKALNHYEQCLQIIPYNEHCLVNWALILQKQNNISKAQEQLSHLVQEHPQEAGPLLAYGMMSLYREDFKDVEVWAKRAIALEPENTNALYLMGRVFYAQKKFKTAKYVLQNAVKFEPEDGLLQLWLGHTLYALQEYSEATLAYAKASQLRPDLTDAHLHYAVLLIKEGDFNKAIEILLPLNQSPSPRVAIYLGNAYLGSRQLDLAKSAYEQAISLQTDLIEAHFNLGLIYNDEKFTAEAPLIRFENAKKQFEQVVQMADKKNPILVAQAKAFLKTITENIEIEKQRLEYEKTLKEEEKQRASESQSQEPSSNSVEQNENSAPTEEMPTPQNETDNEIEKELERQ